MTDRDQMIRFIRSELTFTDLLMQMAEEAAELSQACLKRCRVLEGRNPVAASYEDLSKLNIGEEMADVRLCAEVLGVMDDSNDAKLERWYNRLIHNHDCTEMCNECND